MIHSCKQNEPGKMPAIGKHIENCSRFINVKIKSLNVQGKAKEFCSSLKESHNIHSFWNAM